MENFKIVNNQPLTLECSSPLDGMYKLSPFVWEENGSYHLMIRAVNTSEDAPQKVARVYYGTSEDGLTFNMGDGPVIAPGTNSLDKDGCEDPTVVCINGQYVVYYTGWNQTKLEGQLLMAEGPSIQELKLTDVRIPSVEPYINPKEATVAQMKDKSWVLLFEYADENRSKLGQAKSSSPRGPWKISGEFMKARENSWDKYHLSPGPIITTDGNKTYLFYNGANEKANWRIGVAELDEDGNMIARAESFIISPLEVRDGETDIAFAASAVRVGDLIWLYYTTADKTTFRATIEIVG